MATHTVLNNARNCLLKLLSLSLEFACLEVGMRARSSTTAIRVKYPYKTEVTQEHKWC